LDEHVDGLGSTLAGMDVFCIYGISEFLLFIFICENHHFLFGAMNSSLNLKTSLHYGMLSKGCIINSKQREENMTW
jgi:hypothetical protein